MPRESDLDGIGARVDVALEVVDRLHDDDGVPYAVDSRKDLL